MAWTLPQRWRTRHELKVPRTTPYFWLGKGVSTALGEATSDYLVHTIHPVPAVLLGFAGFVVAMVLQLRAPRYLAWTYWFAVGMVGIFGTMAADVVHVGMGIPYFISAPFFAIVLAAVFVTWNATEPTLSVHAIDTFRRELFYWAAVVATFALGTAAGDLTAVTFHIGYLPSIALYAAIITVPAIGYWRGRWSPAFAFWFAYVVTRPLGASVADGFGKPPSLGGLGYGDGRVALVLAIIMVLVVAYLARTKVDVQRGGRHARSRYTVMEDPSGNIVGIVPRVDPWPEEEESGRAPG